MGIADRLRNLTLKAQQSAADHKDQIQHVVEKAEATADTRTKGKYHDRIANTGAKVESYVEKPQPRGSGPGQGGEARHGGEAPAREAGHETSEGPPRA